VVAVDEDGAVVGVCVNQVYPEDEAVTGRHEALISILGTTRAQRGRGVATAMIAWSLHAFAAAGFDWALIEVDVDNPTGAARLYRNLGFEPLRRSVTYLVEVGAGDRSV
jgi:ribosomal protein S18 acetylase RimI-like enzyme